jgi:hypothetical protein
LLLFFRSIKEEDPDHTSISDAVPFDQQLCHSPISIRRYTKFVYMESPSLKTVKNVLQEVRKTVMASTALDVCAESLNSLYGLVQFNIAPDVAGEWQVVSFANMLTLNTRLAWNMLNAMCQKSSPRHREETAYLRALFQEVLRLL